VVEFDVRHCRLGKDGEEVPLGRIELSEPKLVNDRVTITATLTAPAYWYLLSLTADGHVQLYQANPEDHESYLPHDESEPPRLSATIGTSRWYFRLSEGPGLQAFVVTASRQPLPAYKDWTGRHGLVPLWTRVAPGDVPYVWEYKNGSFDIISSVTRGPGEKRTLSEPVPFRRACEYLANLGDFELVRGRAFAVVPAK
jgi:hypothetical protein